MIAHPSTRRGFTLVEILIVVVILGILAAIVLPKYLNASDEARGSSIATQLQSLRTQIDIYKLQHQDQYPTLVQLQNNWAILTGKTDIDGTLNADGELGPYFRTTPMNVYTNSSTVAAWGAGTTSHGWEYNETTGEIRAVGFDENTLEYTAPESD